MALIKPKLGDDVLQTDIDQTEAINGMKGLFVDSFLDGGNGWIKWDNGTMLQFGKENIGTVQWDSQTAGVYPATNYPITNFMQTFIYPPSITISGTGIGFSLVMPHDVKTSSFRTKLASFSTTSFAIEIKWIAIGRWK